MARRALAIAISLAATLRVAESQTWTDLNPDKSDFHPDWPNAAAGGRVNGLGAARDKSAFYAATEWGGLYKSTDKGATWTHLPAHSPLATWRVAVDPSNAQRVYATSFYDGRVTSLAGINVSTDGGQTWTHPPSTAAPSPLCPDITRTNPSAFGIAVDPDNPARVFVGTDCGLIASEDYGVTWKYVFPQSSAKSGRVWSVVIHHSGVLDICGDSGHNRSKDGGATWIPDGAFQIPGGRCSLAVSPHETDVLFAVAGTTIYESIDGGQNWTSFTESPDPPGAGRIPYITTNARSGMAFDLWYGHAQLYRGGCTAPEPANVLQQCLTKIGGYYGFNLGAHNDAGELLFDPGVSSDACPLLYANDGGIDRNTSTASPNCHSADLHWEQVDVLPHALWVRALAGRTWMNPWTHALTQDLYFGTQDNGTFASFDAHLAKPIWLNVDPADVQDVVMDGLRVVNTVCCDTNGKTLYVRPRGAPGTNMPYGVLTPRPLGGDGVIAQFAGKLYGVLTANGLYLKLDIAQPGSWKKIGWPAAWTPLPKLGSLQVSKANAAGSGAVFFARFIWLDTYKTPKPVSQVWRYSTSPNTWARVKPPDDVGGFGLFAVDPGNPKRFLASHEQDGTDPRMVMSSDGGVSWTALPTLDACMTRSGQFAYRNEAGPTAGTGHWSFEGYHQPTLIAFDPRDTKVLVAGAADAGVFLSFDGGASWIPATDPFHPETSGIPNLPRPRAAYFRDLGDDVALYVGTQGRGVWRLLIDAPLMALPTGC